MSNPYSKHRGPHPGIVATVYVVLSIASLVVIAAFSGGAGFPRPDDPWDKTATTLTDFAKAFRWNTFLLFSAAVPLAIFTSAVTSRLHFLGVNVTGVTIAFTGGLIASLMVTLSASCGWILTRPGVAANLPVMHALQLVGFVTGGVAHNTALGLLMAGISVPCLFGRYTPRWLAWMGIVLAAIAELSSLYMVAPRVEVGLLLLIARFGSYIWMIGTGFTLAKQVVPARRDG